MAAEWSRPVKVMTPFCWPTSVSCWCSASILPRSSVTFDELLAHSTFVEVDRKCKSPIDLAKRKQCRHLMGWPRFAFDVLWAIPIHLLPFATYSGCCYFFCYSKKLITSVCGHSWRDSTEITLLFDFAAPFLYEWFVDFFCIYFFPLKSYSVFSLDSNVSFVVNFLVWDLDPSKVSPQQLCPQKAHPCVKLRQTASFELSCTFMWRSVGPVRDCDKNYFF